MDLDRRTLNPTFYNHNMGYNISDLKAIIRTLSFHFNHHAKPGWGMLCHRSERTYEYPTIANDHAELETV